MIASCIPVIQYHNQEIDMNKICPPFLDFPSFTCIQLCVCISFFVILSPVSFPTVASTIHVQSRSIPGVPGFTLCSHSYFSCPSQPEEITHLFSISIIWSFQECYIKSVWKACFSVHSTVKDSVHTQNLMTTRLLGPFQFLSSPTSLLLQSYWGFTQCWHQRVAHTIHRSPPLSSWGWAPDVLVQEFYNILSSSAQICQREPIYFLSMCILNPLSLSSPLPLPQANLGPLTTQSLGVRRPASVANQWCPPQKLPCPILVKKPKQKKRFAQVLQSITDRI